MSPLSPIHLLLGVWTSPVLTAISWVPNCPLEHRPNHLPVDCEMDTSTLLASENTADIPRTIVATDVALLLDKGAIAAAVVWIDKTAEDLGGLRMGHLSGNGLESMPQ